MTPILDENRYFRDMDRLSKTMEIILARPDFDVNWKSQDSSTALSLVVTEINRIPHNDSANAVDRDLKRG
jgi:hypothetical protein